MFIFDISGEMDTKIQSLTETIQIVLRDKSVDKSDQKTILDWARAKREELEKELESKSE